LVALLGCGNGESAIASLLYCVHGTVLDFAGKRLFGLAAYSAVGKTKVWWKDCDTLTLQISHNYCILKYTDFFQKQQTFTI